MKEYYQINIDGYFSSYKFYNQFIPELHNYFVNRSNEQELLINMSDIQKISPLVIPNFLNVGMILKNYLNYQVYLFIPWNKKILTYLRDINFFTINNKIKIFNIDERYTGDIPVDRTISDICGTILIEKNMNKQEIYNCYISRYKFPLEKKLNDDKLVDRILYIMAELSHNGARHSLGSCFVSFQLNQNNKFEFSVSDCGIGYKKSFQSKIKDRNMYFEHIDDEKVVEQNFIYILEAIYHRKKLHQHIYGIYSIFNDVLPLNGIIRIHTHDTQAIFTQNNFGTFIDGKPNKKLLKNIFKEFVEITSNSFETKYMPVRIQPYKFNGVHIEIEIPLMNINHRNTHENIIGID